MEEKYREDHDKKGSRVKKDYRNRKGSPLYRLRIGQIVDKQTPQTRAEKPFHIFLFHFKFLPVGKKHE